MKFSPEQKTSSPVGLWRYRLAGITGGLLLAAGQFWGPLCVLQLFAFVPALMLCVRDKKAGSAALAGLYMGIAYTLPQMVYLRMPVPVTAILLVEFTVVLILLCVWGCVCISRPGVMGCFAFGAGFFLLDWLNFTLVPIWGMAQSFGRSWSAYPVSIGFIQFTGISGVCFVVGTLSALAARRYLGIDSKKALYAAGGLLAVIVVADFHALSRRPEGTLRVAAAGWIFDDYHKNGSIDPHSEEGFEKVFAGPARQAAADGAKIFTTGEMGFYLDRQDRQKWMERFGEIARETGMWLVCGYFDLDRNRNMIFFMSPDGKIAAEYNKTYLTPYESGLKGGGDLRIIEVDGVKVGAMICQDDNFSDLTRFYGRVKCPVVLCPTADWQTIKDAHLQAVRGRAIECRYAIVRGAANGISAIIGPDGKVLAAMDHYRYGPGFVIADVPLDTRITLLAMFGSWPATAAMAMFILSGLRKKN